MTGKEFRDYVGKIKKLPDVGKEKGKDSVGDQFKFNKVIKYLKVLARCEPDDKYLLVTGL